MCAALVAIVAGASAFPVSPALPASSAATQSAAPPTPEVRAFDAFIRTSAPICLRAPAAHCIKAGWRFADRNRDNRLSAAELDAVRTAVKAWSAWPGNGMSRSQRRSVLLGLMVAEAIGAARLIGLYDEDADGHLSRAELMRDIRLDRRPLGRILQDPRAVDWDRLRARLGALAPALGTLAPTPTE